MIFSTTMSCYYKFVVHKKKIREKIITTPLKKGRLIPFYENGVIFS